jgi:hypothetical protein
MAKTLAIANMPESKRMEGIGSMFGAVSGTGLRPAYNAGIHESKS